MVRFLSLLLMFSVGTAQAAYAPVAETLKAGDYTLIKPTSNSNIKYFNMYVAANGGITTFMEQGNTTNTRYQVPAGKTLRILSATMVAGGAAWGLRIGYGDNSVGGNSATLPTNGLWFAGDGTNTPANGPMIGRVNANSVVTYNPVGMIVPASKYPAIYWEENTSALANWANCIVVGIEE